MQKVKKTNIAKPKGFAPLDVVLAVISVLIAANLAFGPIRIALLGHSLKLFDNLLLFTIWLVFVLLKALPRDRVKLSDVRFFISKYRYELGLAFVMVISGTARFLSIGYGLPHLTESHEQLIVPKVLHMIKNGTFDHGIYDYGSLYFIFLYFVFVLTSFLAGIFGGRIQSVSDIDQALFFLSARAANVILSLVCIYLVYLIGKRISGKRMGLAAAFITALGTVIFLSSVTARLEPLVLIFVLLAFYYIVRLSESGKILDYCLAGLFCGLAVGTKFYSMTIVTALLYSHFLARKLKTFSYKKLLTALLIMFLAYLVTNPFILTNTGAFLRDTSRLTKQIGIMDNWNVVDETPEAVYTRLIFLDGLGVVGTIIFLVLLLFYLVKPDAKRGLLLIIPVVHFLVLIKSHRIFHRYILIIIPFLVLFIVSELEKIIERNKKKLKLNPNLIFWVIIILIALFPAIKMFRITKQYSLDTTSTSAKEWIESTIPAGSRLLVSPYSVNLDGRKFSITKMRKSARKYSQNMISLPESGYNFVVTSSTLKDYGLLRGAAECVDLVKKFEPVSGRIAGRTIFILKVKPAPSAHLKKSASLFLKNNEKKNIINFGIPDEDLIHLGSDWGEAAKEYDISYRMVRTYPAAFFFTVSPSAISIKNLSVSVGLTPVVTGNAAQFESFDIRLNNSLLCTFSLHFDGKRDSIKCKIPVQLLKYGKDINKLEFDIPEALEPVVNLEKQTRSIPMIKYHSVSISVD